MSVTTTVPDERRFIIDTLQKWLKENAQRPGVPYHIYVQDSTPWKLVETHDATQPVAATAPGFDPRRARRRR